MDEDSLGGSVSGIAHNGKACRVLDRTGTVSDDHLEELLVALVRERRFGQIGRSRQGEQTVALDAPELGHVQLGDRLYRLIVRRYEARLEVF